MQPGVYHDIPNDEYHDSEGISNTGLGDVLQSGYHYWARHLDPRRPKRKPLQSQEDGHISHCAILEPDAFNDRYIVGPDANRNTRVWKDFCEVHPDKTIIKMEQYNRAMRQRDEVWKIPDVAEALSKGHAEVSAYWTDPETGVQCRCRPDFIHEAGGGVVLLDVKTFDDARGHSFERQVARMNYHRQDAYYSDGYGIASNQSVLGFIFITVEMPWPHAATATMLDDDSKEAGRRQYRDALNLYAKCLRDDEWPGYEHSIGLMRLPHWALED